LARNHKYILDLSDLQYKRVRIPLEKKLLNFLMWFGGSILVAFLYFTVFANIFGSPKERILKQQLGNLKLKYSLVGRQLDYSVQLLQGLKLSDELRYRTILDMDSVPESYRKGGFGGVDRFSDLAGYDNSDLIISFRTKIEELKTRANVQMESFKSVAERSADWIRDNDHFPGISPVNVMYRLGDGYKWREIHPVLGTPRMHYGQDFEVPPGTDVYATGDGKVIESGWNSGGFGNYVVIDHGSGYVTTYGHLSSIRVPKGMNVKRCDLIGLSGSTGTSSGPHLHYQIERFGEHINPLNNLPVDMTNEEFNEMIQAFGSKSKFR
jgi:murein DD-endopeptidase MepM/ murein hydrolase activator NlpD